MALIGQNDSQRERNVDHISLVPSWEGKYPSYTPADTIVKYSYIGGIYNEICKPSPSISILRIEPYSWKLFRCYPHVWNCYESIRIQIVALLVCRTFALQIIMYYMTEHTCIYSLVGLSSLSMDRFPVVTYISNSLHPLHHLILFPGQVRDLN